MHRSQSVNKLWRDTEDKLLKQKMNLENMFHHIKVVSESEKERYISDMEKLKVTVKTSSADQVCFICL